MKRLIVILMVVCMMGSVTVMAEDKEARIAEIEKQIEELQAELAELKGDEEKAEGDVLYQDDKVIIRYAGISGEGTDYDINFEIENLSDKTLMVQLKNTSLNGYMVDLLMSTDIAPGKKAKDGAGFAIWDKEIASEYPLEDLESIETAFSVFDRNKITDNYTTDQIVIK